MPKLDLVPSRDGFHFRNSFENVFAPGVFNIRTSGLCGGMVMTAIDHWRSGIPIPTHHAGDVGSAEVPAR